jgi:hypothetical protein
VWEVEGLVRPSSAWRRRRRHLPLQLVLALIACLSIVAAQLCSSSAFGLVKVAHAAAAKKATPNRFNPSSVSNAVTHGDPQPAPKGTVKSGPANFDGRRPAVPMKPFRMDLTPNAETGSTGGDGVLQVSVPAPIKEHLPTISPWNRYPASLHQLPRWGLGRIFPLHQSLGL